MTPFFGLRPAASNRATLDIDSRRERARRKETIGLFGAERSRPLSLNQVAELSQNCGDKGTLVLTLACTGLRWGEAVGLRVKDFDIVRHRLNVRSNAVRVGGKVVAGTPKSHESRSVPFPEMLTELLM